MLRDLVGRNDDSRRDAQDRGGHCTQKWKSAVTALASSASEGSICMRLCSRLSTCATTHAFLQSSAKRLRPKGGGAPGDALNRIDLRVGSAPDRPSVTLQVLPQPHGAQRTLEMFPDRGDLYDEIADVYEQKKMFREAFAARQRARETSRRFGPARIWEYAVTAGRGRALSMSELLI